MLNSLTRPYPLLSLREALWRDALFSILLAVFLLIFRPFGLEVYGFNRAYVILGYGIISLITTTANDAVAYLVFTNTFTEKNWVVYKQLVWLLWHLLLLGITCFCYAASIDAFPFTITGFLKVQLYVLLCALVPVTLLVTIKQNYLLKRNLAEAEQLAGGLGTAVTPVIPAGANNITEQPITLYSENSKEWLVVKPASLMLLAAQDNYVKCYWLEDGSVKKKLLRNTLSRIEDALQDYKQFFRCHRGYIINLTAVSNISGNSQGYTAVLNFINTNIPVSRSKGKELQQALSN